MKRKNDLPALFTLQYHINQSIQPLIEDSTNMKVAYFNTQYSRGFYTQGASSLLNVLGGIDQTTKRLQNYAEKSRRRLTL